MSFQKCPVCDGVGSTGIGFPIGEPCSVCQGQKIINSDTGVPPFKIITTTGTTVTIPILEESLEGTKNE